VPRRARDHAAGGYCHGWRGLKKWRQRRRWGSIPSSLAKAALEYTLAEELGVNLFYGGHYATETFGVKALAEHISAKFGLTWEFVDHPTGL